GWAHSDRVAPGRPRPAAAAERHTGRDRRLPGRRRGGNHLRRTARPGHHAGIGVMRIVQLANFYAPTSGGLRVAVDRLRAGYRAHGDVPTLIVPGAHHRAEDCVIEIASPRLPNGSGYRVIVSHRAVL